MSVEIVTIFNLDIFIYKSLQSATFGIYYNVMICHGFVILGLINKEEFTKTIMGLIW